MEMSNFQINIVTITEQEVPALDCHRDNAHSHSQTMEWVDGGPRDEVGGCKILVKPKSKESCHEFLRALWTLRFLGAFSHSISINHLRVSDVPPA